METLDQGVKYVQTIKVLERRHWRNFEGRDLTLVAYKKGVFHNVFWVYRLKKHY